MSEKLQKRFIEKIRHKIWLTSDHFKMLENDDHVLIGVSGGKDSLVLLETLAIRRKIYKLPYKISAAHINVNEVPYEIDADYFRSMCAELEVDCYIENISVDLERADEKGHCFICAWHRRKRLFDLSREINCNKIALGHHLDDAVQTQLMNMLYHGSTSSMPPILKMFSGRVLLVRPLLFLHEKDVQQYSDYRNFKLIEKTCPYEDDTNRKFVRNLIETIDKHNKIAKTNIFNSTTKIFDEYILKEKFKFK
ncbi:MAG: hypothetical protein A2W91_20200 [Bacteroidetes bacterium GWF2_38_335]|nr:MAG: hypothetical protein A2W91_20200 [Bacteroidetes bacterium GWF2_38_335]OFY79517.1 MAG: hypothetical protein A2281_13885 [Bacteroidetes bacterium RIFOXYA12_FULL_38_20]HBS86544.1 tRNA 2-thiocytidine(32) synthetase TtcA [Bacteroidales bacterium]